MANTHEPSVPDGVAVPPPTDQIIEKEVTVADAKYKVFARTVSFFGEQYYMFTAERWWSAAPKVADDNPLAGLIHQINKTFKPGWAQVGGKSSMLSFLPAEVVLLRFQKDYAELALAICGAFPQMIGRDVTSTEMDDIHVVLIPVYRLPEGLA